MGPNRWWRKRIVSRVTRCRLPHGSPAGSLLERSQQIVIGTAVLPSEQRSRCAGSEPSQSLLQVFSLRVIEVASLHVKQLAFEESDGKFLVERPRR